MFSLRPPSLTLSFLLCLIALTLFNAPAYCTDRSVLFDFDGDGKTDISVYRMGEWTPTNRGTSYFYYLSSLTGEIVARPFGAGGDRPAVADYDIDGKADLAIFRSWEDALENPWEASDYWINHSSTGNTQVIYHLGHGTIVNRNFVDTPALELGVYNYRVEGDPQDGCYIQGFLLAAGENFYQKDITEDCFSPDLIRVPALGDYNNDGYSDAAVFVRNLAERRRSHFEIWPSPMIAGYTAPPIVAPFDADFPTPGDFDCDGATDLAGGRFENGRLIWRMRFSSNGTIWTVPFGIDGDKPVPGDYDGDCKTDPAVFRPSTGVWYIFRSSDWNWEAYQFGIETDIPIPQPNVF